ncbi:MAG: hypothetical protein M1815_003569 [Lichina confinis]|nr:MAG: hypothetical protein M1815_003569 [Lichina confinis]
MSSYELSIGVFGPGKDPNNRSHWAFVVSKPGDAIGDRLHVVLLDRNSLRYVFEIRSGVPIKSLQSEGRCVITVWDSVQRQKGVHVIESELAPQDGKRRCQDWVLSTLISLEVEELVPSATSERWEALVGKSATEVEAALGDSWERHRD